MKLDYRKNSGLVIGIHLFIWIILFSLPYLLSSGEFSILDRLAIHSWLPLCFYAVLFYVNYFLLIDRLLFRKKVLAFVLVNALLMTLFLILNWQLVGMLAHVDKMPFPALSNMLRPNPGQPPMQPPVMGQPMVKLFIYKDIISIFIPLIFSVLIKIAERWIKTEAERKDREKENLRSELQHLKYQLHPHFFFNSLNNIYALVDASPEKAKETIHTLGKLMRYFLYETNMEKVSLADEVNFIKRYISLMALRVSEHVQVKVSIPEISPGLQIAPLLFISIIENAFKHGISATGSSPVFFQMTITGSQLCFISENENLPKDESDKSGSGIGLDNLKKRLELLYPEKHTLENSITGSRYRTRLVIDLAE